jgi:hypothetical protein
MFHWMSVTAPTDKTTSTQRSTTGSELTMQDECLRLVSHGRKLKREIWFVLGVVDAVQGQRYLMSETGKFTVTHRAKIDLGD